MVSRFRQKFSGQGIPHFDFGERTKAAREGNDDENCCVTVRRKCEDGEQCVRLRV